MLVVFNFKNQMSIKQQLELLEKFNQPINKQHQLIIAPIIPNYDEYHFASQFKICQLKEEM